MLTSPERAPTLAPDSQSNPGMPFHWAMAFACLIFMAMCVAFWCGHSFSVATMEMFTK